MGFRPEIRDRLPLPLARLYRRAFNAKSRLERHGHALYLCEAMLKCAASVQIAAYLDAGGREPAIDELLRGLALPSLGHWAEFLERIARHLAGRPSLAIPELGAVAAHLLEGRDDLPATRSALRTMSRRVGRVAPAKGERVCVLDFLQRLAPYRNEVVGHGALRDEAFYAEMADELLDAATELFERTDVWTAGALVFVAQLSEGAGGGRTYELWNLMGPDAVREELARPGDAAAAPLAPGHVYLRRGDRFLDLHPLLVCEPAPPEASVVFLNRSRSGARVEYLDYVSGETFVPPALLRDHRAILARILGRDLSEAGATALAASCAGVDAEPEVPLPEGARRFGEFDLVGKLGEGGMGAVYLGHQRSVSRVVALKMLPPARVGDEIALARFQKEVRALARADHPNVVRVFQSGQTEGTFWYSMEFVEGCDLRAVAASVAGAATRGGLRDTDLLQAVSTASDRRRADLAQSLPTMPQLQRPAPPSLGAGRSYFARVAELFRDASRGLQHLHERGVLHRDVKPGNIMVTRADGRAVLMDLGLAMVSGEGTVSDAREVLGTIPYTAPEQLLRSKLRVDHRADIYGMGASLYELVTGRPPYEAEDDAALVARVVREAPPAPRRVDPTIPVDLDAIVRKAMDRDPERRYATAAALADDLERFALGLPVAAQPPTLRHLAGLWYRRHRAVSWTAAAAALALLVAGAWFVRSIAVERDRATDAERDAVADRDRAREAEAKAATARDAEARSAAAATAAAQRAEAATRRAEGLLVTTRAMSLLAASSQEQTQQPMLSVLLARDALRTQRTPAAISRAQGALAGCLERRSFSTDGVGVTAVALAGTGWIAAGGANGHLWIWDPADPRAAVTFPAHRGRVASLEFSRRGDLLLSAGEDGTARVWTVGGARVAEALGSGSPLAFAAFLDFDRRFVTVPSQTRDFGRGWPQPNTDHTVRLWTVAGNRIGEVTHAAPVTFGVRSHTRDLLLTGDETGRGFVIDGAGVVRGAAAHDSALLAGAFSSDDTLVATISAGDLSVWQLDGPTRRARAAFEDEGTFLLEAISGAAGETPSATERPPGRTTTPPSPVGATRVYREDLRQRGVAGIAYDRIAFVDDDRAIWAAGPSGRILIGPTPPLVRRKPGFYDGAHLGGSGGREFESVLERDQSSFTAAGLAAGPIEIRRRGTSAVLLTLAPKAAFWKTLPLHGHDGTLTAVDADPETGVVVTGSSDATVRLWRAYGAAEATFPGAIAIDPIAEFTTSPTTDQILVARESGGAELWDVAERRSLPIERPRGRGGLRYVRYGPDGTHLVGTGLDGNAYVWDASGRLRSTLHHPAAEAFRIVGISRGGRFVAAIGPKSIHALDRETGRVASLTYEGDITSAPVVSPDGRAIAFATAWPPRQRLATGGAPYEDIHVVIWSPETHEARPLFGHRLPVFQLAFDETGQRLVSASGDAARVWDRAGARLDGFAEADQVVVAAFFAERRVRLVSVSPDRAVGFLRDLDGASTFAFRPDDRLMSAALGTRGGHGGAGACGKGRGSDELDVAGDDPEVTATRDGSRIALRLAHGVSVVDARGRELLSLGHESCGDSGGIRISASGRSVVNLYAGRLRVFSTDPDDVLRAVEARIDRDYSEAERTRYLGLLGLEAREPEGTPLGSDPAPVFDFPDDEEAPAPVRVPAPAPAAAPGTGK